MGTGSRGDLRPSFVGERTPSPRPQRGFRLMTRAANRSSRAWRGIGEGSAGGLRKEFQLVVETDFTQIREADCCRREALLKSIILRCLSRRRAHSLQTRVGRTSRSVHCVDAVCACTNARGSDEGIPVAPGSEWNAAHLRERWAAPVNVSTRALAARKRFADQQPQVEPIPTGDNRSNAGKTRRHLNAVVCHPLSRRTDQRLINASIRDEDCRVRHSHGAWILDHEKMNNGY